MNKFLTKIIGATLAFAMMIGVGIYASGREPTPVKAESLTASITFGNTSGKTNLTHTTTSVTDSQSNSWAFSVTGAGGKSSYQNNVPQLGNSSNKPSAASFTWTLANSYKITAMSFGVSSGSSNGSGSVAFKIDGTAYNANPNTYSGTSETVISKSSMDVTVASGKKVAFEITNSNGSLRIYRLSVTYETVSSNLPTVESVSVSGEMSKKTYTTVDSWSNSGLTAEAAMSDNSDYEGEFEWTYNPTSPTAAVIANNNAEVNNLSVTATATADNKSGNKATSGISVQYATVAQLTAATPATGDSDNVIAKGIVSQIGEINTNSGKRYASYYISDDGSQNGQYYVFKGKGVDNADITNSNDIQLGDIVVVYGVVTNYNGTTKEFKQGNYLLSLERPVSQNPAITITTPNISMKVGDADVAVNADAENIPEGGSIAWETGNTSIATIVQVNETFKVHAVAAGSTTVTAKILNSSSQPVASNSITVTVTANALEDGDTFVIKAVYSAQATYYMTGITDNLGTASLNREDAIVFTAVESETSGQFKIKYVNNYLNFTGSSNAVYFTSDNASASTSWTATDTGSSIVIANVNATSRKLQFNYNNGNPRFACYTTTQGAIVIEKVTAPEVDTVTVVGDSSADGQDALSITKNFYYEVTYVDSTNAGHQEVSVTVLNSNDATDGASVTTEPSNGEFSVTFTANDTYTVTVTSLEDSTKSDSTTILIHDLHVTILTDYNLYSNDTLVEGDYILFFSNTAVKAEISGDRAQYEEVTPNNNKISTELLNIVWHISPDGDDYYTIYNALEDKYLASTNSKNEAKLESTVTDNSRWTIEASNGTFDFANKARAAGTNPGNKYLRKNNTIGYGCYASTTGGALTLYKKNAKSSTEDLTTNTQLSYRYTKDSNNYTFSDISMRFGGYISKDLWNELDTGNHLIEGFGVMFTSTNVVHAPDSIKSKAGEAVAASANNDYANTLVNFYMPKTSMATPAEDGDDYYWNLFFSVDFDEISINKYYVAAAYIKVDGEYVFMKEVKYSVTSLAQDYLDHRNCDGTTAEGSLAKLASLSPAE